MDWLYPSGSYDPISNGQSPRGLSAWALSNSALANLNKTTNQLIAEGQQQNSLAPPSEGLAAIPAGSNDPNTYGGYGHTNDPWGVGLTVLGMLTSPVTTFGRIAATMMMDPYRSRPFGLDDIFFGINPDKDVIAPDGLEPSDEPNVDGEIAGKPGHQSLAEMAFGVSPEAAPGKGGSMDANEPSGPGGPEQGKGDTPEGGKDGGSKFAAGGLIGGSTGGLADLVSAGPDSLSDGEYVLPADFVAMLGDGNTKAGGAELDKAVARLRKLKYGRGKQPPAFRGTLEDLL